MADALNSKSKKNVRLDDDSTKTEEKKDDKLKKKLTLSLPMCPGRSLRQKKPSKGRRVFQLLECSYIFNRFFALQIKNFEMILTLLLLSLFSVL